MRRHHDYLSCAHKTMARSSQLFAPSKAPFSTLKSSSLSWWITIKRSFWCAPSLLQLLANIQIVCARKRMWWKSCQQLKESLLSWAQRTAELLSSFALSLSHSPTYTNTSSLNENSNPDLVFIINIKTTLLFWSSYLPLFLSFLLSKITRMLLLDPSKCFPVQLYLNSVDLQLIAASLDCYQLTKLAHSRESRINQRLSCMLRNSHSHNNSNGARKWPRDLLNAYRIQLSDSSNSLARVS